MENNITELPRAMTAGERGELGKAVRLNAKVAKDGIAAAEARLVADVEKQLSATYGAYDAAWHEVTAEAARAMESADAQIAERCKALGIPEQFRPRIALSWYGRGENAAKERRSELRMTARTEIAARGKQAKCEIDRLAAGLQMQLATGSLKSNEARQFMAAIPSIDALMPALSLDDIEKKTPQRRIA